MVDKRAVKILKSTYWNQYGWRLDGEKTLSKEDRDYAESKGVMFDPVDFDHAALVAKAISVRDHVQVEDIANAFVWSLATRELDYRSALGSFAVLRHFPNHQPTGSQNTCEVCGFLSRKKSVAENLNVLNFERLKWGGVRHLMPCYAAFDLQQFQQLPKVDINSEQIQLLNDLFAAVNSTPPGTSVSKLHSYLPRNIKANKDERNTMIAILGYCGILSTDEHIGFNDSFVKWNQRQMPSRWLEMPYPACWWSGGQGLNQDAVDFWFGHLL